MSVLEFIASLVRSVAWPAILLVVVIILRRPIAAALAGGLSRLKIGPFEAEWRVVAEATRKQAARGATSAEQKQIRDRRTFAEGAFLRRRPRRPNGGSSQNCSELPTVCRTPGVWVAGVRAAGDDEHRRRGSGPSLRRSWGRGPRPPPRPNQRATRQAVEGLSVMRNLAVHDDDTTGRLDAAKALEFIDLVAATLFAIRFERTSSQTS